MQNIHCLLNAQKFCPFCPFCIRAVRFSFIFRILRKGYSVFAYVAYFTYLLRGDDHWWHNAKEMQLCECTCRYGWMHEINFIYHNKFVFIIFLYQLPLNFSTGYYLHICIFFSMDLNIHALVRKFLLHLIGGPGIAIVTYMYTI